MFSFPKNSLEFFVVFGNACDLQDVGIGCTKILEDACLFQTKIPFVSNLTFDVLKIRLKKMFGLTQIFSLEPHFFSMCYSMSYIYDAKYLIFFF